MVQPIILHGGPGGPNPVKVAIILEELNVPYTSVIHPYNTLHTPTFEKYNPNGRVPAIEDPNTDITLWESGAILEYLVETYDPSGVLHPLVSPDKHLARQYLHFQMSGQGPYFGQYYWFSHSHPEKFPSAVERYRNEIKRVTKVLDGVLKGKEALVGGKVSFVDLAYVPWYKSMSGAEDGKLLAELEADNPDFKRWLHALLERPSVVKVYKEVEERKERMAKEAEAKI